ncbi:hypothetical protein AMJ80_06880 [bacterium SM23_31]|nr:MAG: hypothetical protein AMJ80_06880 [bacterium SM23_31]
MLTSVFFISSASIIIRYSDAPPLIIAFYRVFFAAVLLYIFAPSSTNRHLRRIDRQTLLTCALAGFFLALHFATWITSLSYTTIANSVVLVDSGPLIALFLSHFILKEKGSPTTFGAILIAMTGVVIISWGDFSTDSGHFTGDVLAVIGAFGTAAYLICGRVIRQRMPLTPFLVLVYGFAALFLCIYCFITRIDFFGYTPYNYLLFAALAVFPTIGGHSLILYTLRYMKAYLANLAFLGEPVAAPVLAFLFFREAPSWFFYAGGILIILGSLAAIVHEGRREK